MLLTEEMNHFLLVYIVGAALTLAGCASPQVAVDCARTPSGDIRLTIQKNCRVTGLGDLRLWERDANEYLWFVSIGHLQSNVVVLAYGEVPQTTHGFQQRKPQPPVKPVDPRCGSVFYVGLEFFYDSAWPPSACAANATFKFGVTPNGAIEHLGSIWHPWQMAHYAESVHEPTQDWPRP
jgi:hypothetical protein